MADKIMRFIKSIWKPILFWIIIAIGIFLLSWLIAFLSYERNDRINKIASMFVLVDTLTVIFGIPIFVIMKCLNRKFRIILTIIILFFVLFIIVSTYNMQAATRIIDVVSQVIVYVLVGFLLCGIGMIFISMYNGFQRFTGKYKAGTILMLGDQTASDKLDEMALCDVSMKLRSGEVCFFEGEGSSYHSKDMVFGYEHSSRGSSIRVMRGYSIHRSKGQSDVIRKTVKTEYPGRLFITNERIVFLSERYGFDIGFDELSNITVYNKYLEVFAGSRFYRVFTPHTVFIRDLITLMNICHEDQYPENDPLS